MNDKFYRHRLSSKYNNLVVVQKTRYEGRATGNKNRCGDPSSIDVHGKSCIALSAIDFRKFRVVCSGVRSSFRTAKNATIGNEFFIFMHQHFGVDVENDAIIG